MIFIIVKNASYVNRLPAIAITCEPCSLAGYCRLASGLAQSLMRPPTRISLSVYDEDDDEEEGGEVVYL